MPVLETLVVIGFFFYNHNLSPDTQILRRTIFINFVWQVSLLCVPTSLHFWIIMALNYIENITLHHINEMKEFSVHNIGFVHSFNWTYSTLPKTSSILLLFIETFGFFLPH